MLNGADRARETIRGLPEALSVLEEIWEFFAEDSFEAADSLIEGFYRAFGEIAQMPGTGHKDR